MCSWYPRMFTYYVLCTFVLHYLDYIFCYKRETMKNNVTLFGLLLLSKEHP